MTAMTIQATWRFVQSPTYTTVSILVGVIVTLFISALVIEQEVSRVPYRSVRVQRPPWGTGVGIPLLLCFSVIVALRLADLAYRRPGTTPTNTDTRAVAAARSPAASGQPDGPLAPSNPAFSQFFITGGVSGSGEHAYVALANPTVRAATVRLTFFFTNGRSIIKMLRVPPVVEQEVPISSLEQVAGPFDLRVEANQHIVVELRRGGNGQQYDLPLGTTKLATTWCRTQGYAYLNPRESATILNLDSRLTARVTLYLQPRSKATASDTAETLPPRSQFMVDVHSLALKEIVSMVVTANRPVCIALVPPFDKSAYAATAPPGSSGASTGGITTQRIQTLFLERNPGARASAAATGPAGDRAAPYVTVRVP
jgi:hypothetical protein